MKKLIAYPATWILYWFGLFVWNEFKSMSYSTYWHWSLKIQRWGNLTKPWI